MFSRRGAETQRERGGRSGFRIGVCAVRRLGKLACQIAWPHSPRSSLREVRPPLSLVQHTNKSSAPLRPCGRIPLIPSRLRGLPPRLPIDFPYFTRRCRAGVRVSPCLFSLPLKARPLPCIRCRCPMGGLKIGLAFTRSYQMAPLVPHSALPKTASGIIVSRLLHSLGSHSRPFPSLTAYEEETFCRCALSTIGARGIAFLP